jgi:hypothetical protein
MSMSISKEVHSSGTFDWPDMILFIILLYGANEKKEDRK